MRAIHYLPLATIILLAGCAHRADPEVRTVEVRVPIRAPCVTADIPPAPAYPDANLPATPDAAAERYQRIAAANAMRTGRLAILEPLVAACR